MSRKKIIERKKKQREVLSKTRVLRRRTQIRAEHKWTNEQELKAKIIVKLENKYPEQMKRYEREKLMKLPLETLKKIENNIKILQNLEDEYNREVSAREALNNQLESEGHITPEDKMKALTPQQVQDLMGKDVGMGGSAECSFTVNKPKKDTADVEIVKAPQSDAL